jgi:hypothetical protein
MTATDAMETHKRGLNDQKQGLKRKRDEIVNAIIKVTSR